MAASIGTLIDRALSRDEDLPPSIARLRERTGGAAVRMAQRLGEANEGRLLAVLGTYELPPWLVSVRRALVDEDRRGADLVALLADGREIGIQVKSSGRRAVEFIEQGRAMHGDRAWRFALVVVRESEPDASLFARALDRIERASQTSAGLSSLRREESEKAR